MQGQALHMWKTEGGGSAWPDARELVRTSDDILCRQNGILSSRLATQNSVATCPQWYDQLTDKDPLAEGSLLRAYRAGCGDASARRNDASQLVATGWQLPVCDDTYANNVVASSTGAICAPRHQAFMNHTRRNTGSMPVRR